MESGGCGGPRRRQEDMEEEEAQREHEAQRLSACNAKILLQILCFEGYQTGAVKRPSELPGAPAVRISRDGVLPLATRK